MVIFHSYRQLGEIFLKRGYIGRCGPKWGDRWTLGDAYMASRAGEIPCRTPGAGELGWPTKPFSIFLSTFFFCFLFSIFLPF
jgi:hypothetical protein